MHLENTPQSFNFTSIQSRFLSVSSGFCCNLWLFYQSALSVTLAVPLSHQNGPWIENPFRRKCVSPVHLELLTAASYLQLRTRRKGARSEQGSRAHFVEYKQTNTDDHACAKTTLICLVGAVRALLQMIYLPSWQ